MKSLAKKQQEMLSDDTYNFLLELRVVCFGAYVTLINFARTDHKAAREFAGECQRYYDKWLGTFNYNIFEIIKAARQDIIQ